ncbi:uncharacterized protein LOC124349247 [Daphnia pulicaria]|uniref:uncharacterized protein LOC124349247 n=1 Tax=Daphnia pulicaria TaxID=35523 RepID=UPI001EEA89A0|nr:uncharacterized protein LOC124349247 [Daphnia pulicaria]
MDERCAICTTVFIDRAQKVPCFVCKTLMHRLCISALTQMEYFRIRKEKEVFLYKCSVCIRMSDALSPILDSEQIVGNESSTFVDQPLAFDLPVMCNVFHIQLSYHA